MDSQATFREIPLTVVLDTDPELAGLDLMAEGEREAAGYVCSIRIIPLDEESQLISWRARRRDGGRFRVVDFRVNASVPGLDLHRIFVPVLHEAIGKLDRISLPWGTRERSFTSWSFPMIAALNRMDQNRFCPFTLCPRVEEVRDYVRRMAEHLMRAYGADGLKVDMIDALRGPEYHRCTADHGHDIESYGEAMYALFKEIHDAVKGVRSDALIEFRMNYRGRLIPACWKMQSDESPLCVFDGCAERAEIRGYFVSHCQLLRHSTSEE